MDPRGPSSNDRSPNARAGPPPLKNPRPGPFIFPFINHACSLRLPATDRPDLAGWTIHGNSRAGHPSSARRAHATDRDHGPSATDRRLAPPGRSPAGSHCAAEPSRSCPPSRPLKHRDHWSERHIQLSHQDVHRFFREARRATRSTFPMSMFSGPEAARGAGRPSRSYPLAPRPVCSAAESQPAPWKLATSNRRRSDSTSTAADQSGERDERAGGPEGAAGER